MGKEEPGPPMPRGLGAEIQDVEDRAFEISVCRTATALRGPNLGGTMNSGEPFVSVVRWI
jgi:hypothetical protein